MDFNYIFSIDLESNGIPFGDKSIDKESCHHLSEICYIVIAYDVHKFNFYAYYNIMC